MPAWPTFLAKILPQVHRARAINPSALRRDPGNVQNDPHLEQPDHHSVKPELRSKKRDGYHAPAAHRQQAVRGLAAHLPEQARRDPLPETEYSPHHPSPRNLHIAPMAPLDQPVQKGRVPLAAPMRKKSLERRQLAPLVRATPHGRSNLSGTVLSNLLENLQESLHPPNHRRHSWQHTHRK